MTSPPGRTIDVTSMADPGSRLAGVAFSSRPFSDLPLSEVPFADSLLAVILLTASVLSDVPFEEILSPAKLGCMPESVCQGDCGGNQNADHVRTPYWSGPRDIPTGPGTGYCACNGG